MIKLKNILNEIYEGGIPRFLYHATVRKLTPSIFKKGLLPNGIEYHMYKFSMEEPGVYMSSDKQFAISMVETADEDSSNIPEEWFEDIVVLFIDIHKLDNKKLFEKDPRFRGIEKDPKSFLYRGIIPPSAIMRMEDQYGHVVPMNEMILKENSQNEDLKPEVEKLQFDLKREFSQIEYLHIYLTSNEEELFINSLHIKPDSQGRGYGSKIMNRIIDFADMHGLYITLKPEPEPGRKADLRRFYKMFGFYPNSGRYGISKYGGAFGLYLIRRPKL